MKSLVLSCTFVAYTYQGVRLTPEQKEELDWPPAPGRLHQALMAAALKGVPKDRESEFEKDAVGALRWLEEQPPPVIVASAICEEDARKPAATRFRLAIPQNNPAKSDFTRTSLLLAPTLMRRAIGRSNQQLLVDYIWELRNAGEEEVGAQHCAVLSDLAAQIRYLGRGEDQIEAHIILQQTVSAREGCEVWRPTDAVADVDLLVARPHTTSGLIRHHWQPVPARTRKSPASRFLREQGYTREATAGLLPVHVAIFQLFADSGDPDELPLSCDAENAGIWRAAIRQRAVDLARDRERWDDEDVAVELVTGHPPGDPGRSAQPHLAFVPLPSIGAHGKADGRVRRFALLGYARTGADAAAAEVYRVLSAALDGEIVGAGGSYYRLQLFDGRPQNDKVWFQFVRSARVWHSVTPVALARGFKIPTLTPDGSRRLTGNERHLRRLAEWTALLRASLRHIRLPDELAASCTIILTASPLVPHTQRAESYRPPGESAVFTHARIEFTQPVRGPLLVGDRRYFGYGLFFPD